MKLPFAAQKQATFMVCLILFGVTLLLFSRAVPHAFLDCDDPDYVTQNSQVKAGLTSTSMVWAFTSGAAGNWHPLTWLSHELDWQLFGNNPYGHHATSVFIHALNAVLAFLAFRKLTQAFWLSALSAALFAWHPLRVESVAWIAERKDVLSVFFALLALWSYAAYARSQRGRAAIYYGLTLVSFTLGLLCKPMLVTLPFLFLLLDGWPLRRWTGQGGEYSFSVLLFEKFPLFVLSTASCVITYLVQKAGGAMTDALSYHDRLYNAIVSLAGYLGKFFWPVHLMIGYPRLAADSGGKIIASAILLGVITGVVLWQWRQRPWLLVGWLWFVVALTPVIGLVPVGLHAMADRYTYLPVIGLQLAILWSLRECNLLFHFRWVPVTAAALVLVLCIGCSWQQIVVWKNSNTLYEHALTLDGKNYIAHAYLGVTLLNEGRFSEAAVHLQRAVEIKPNYITARQNLGFVQEKLGQSESALATYKIAVQLAPDDATTQFRCANLLARLDRDTEALLYYEKVIRLRPNFAQAYCNEADSLRALNRPGDAANCYRKAINLQTSNAIAHFGLGVSLEMLGRPTDALASYQNAIRIEPQLVDAHYNLGVLYLNQNQASNALTHFQAAVQVRTNNCSILVGMGLAEEQLGRTREAVEYYEQAFRLNPRFAGLAENLAQAKGNLADQPVSGQ